MLCRYCKSLDLDLASTKAWAPHHETMTDLRSSAKAGCHMCMKVVEDYELESYKGAVEDLPLAVRFDRRTRDLAWRQDLGMIATGRNFANIAYYQTWTKRDDPLDKLFGRRMPHKTTNCDEFFGMVQYWIDTCSTTHERCRSTKKPLPSRVIDVGDDITAPRLFITEGKYDDWMALSYCWGSAPPLKTEIATLAQRCREIEWEELPALLRDAFVITRRLGFRYLWVDALCIIQDDANDWAVESMKMAEIYKGAFLTILAESSLDCSVGIFESSSENRPTTPEGVKLHARSERYGLESDLIVCRPSDEIPIFSRDVDGWGRMGPLSDRAWTLQEELLSWRILRFAKGKAWWECQETEWNEWCPEDEKLQDRGLSIPAALPRITLLNGDEKFRDTRCEPLDIWYQAVSDLIKRGISYRSDIFPAISGVAKDTYRHIKQEYKAGLWLDHIHTGLLWSVGYIGAKRTEAYTAPSWSWASLDLSSQRGLGISGRRIYPALNVSGRQHKTANILEVNVITKGKDPFGPVVSGSMKISGPAQTVCSCRIYGTLDCFDGTEKRGTGDRETIGDHSKIAAIPDLRCGEGQGVLHEEWIYLHIASEYSKRCAVALCLILKATGTMGQYIRIGSVGFTVDTLSYVAWPEQTVEII
ncbi:hypothetical protein VTL71DRAFT_14017 [Oculimacula yallundae]|uniref:Heterokaryon incompatibility domain-containing protein n=1 Tax=Oculimacula yallundae TaxID=86028 RepID=A0ABR4CLY7_9HELO